MKNDKWKLTRNNPDTGFKETIVYTGNLRDEPRGWKVIKKLQNN